MILAETPHVVRAPTSLPKTDASKEDLRIIIKGGFQIPDSLRKFELPVTLESLGKSLMKSIKKMSGVSRAQIHQVNPYALVVIKTDVHSWGEIIPPVMKVLTEAITSKREEQGTGN